MSAARRIEPIAPRELHVLEMQGPDGSWFPMYGDAYPDREDAEDRQRECSQRTRIAIYRPVSS